MNLEFQEVVILLLTLDKISKIKKQKPGCYLNFYFSMKVKNNFNIHATALGKPHKD
jgi:hypothetical protein